MQPWEKAYYRGIMLLCQVCGGDLVSIGVDRHHQPAFDCKGCGEQWVWTEAGWKVCAPAGRR